MQRNSDISKIMNPLDEILLKFNVNGKDNKLHTKCIQKIHVPIVSKVMSNDIILLH